MTHLMEADFYRLFRSKGFWINQILLITATISMVLSKIGGFVGVQESLEQAIGGNVQITWTAEQTLIASAQMAPILLYFFIILFTIVVGYDLVHETLKNLITTGVSRLKFFILKYLIFLLMTGLQFVFYYALAFIVGGLKNGIGTFGADYWLKFFQAFLLQFIALQAIFAIAFLVIYLLNSSVIAVLSVIVLTLLVSIFATQFSSTLKFIAYFDFQSHLGLAIRASGEYWTRSIIVSLSVIVICLFSAYTHFKKKDF